jgi:hypothetical protein
MATHKWAIKFSIWPRLDNVKISYSLSVNEKLH